MNPLHYSIVSSSITEFVPALCFNHRFLPKSVSDLENFFENIDLDSNESKQTFLSDSNRETAKKYQILKNTIDLSLKEEKFRNCLAIIDYLFDENKKTSIDRVIWGYKEKPLGVTRKHPGDIYLKYSNGDILGVSVKTGIESTFEPKLNSYVKSTLLKSCWVESIPDSLYQMKRDIWKNVYSNIQNIPNSVNDDNFFILSGKRLYPNKMLIDTLCTLQENDNAYFELLYSNLLNTCKTNMINWINAYPSTTLNWIRSEFRLNNIVETPLVLLKAIDTKYQLLFDDLSEFLPKVKHVNAYSNPNSIQDWYIDLISKDQTRKLLMTIRSDQGFRRDKPKGKLGAFLNLKLQYRGYKC